MHNLPTEILILIGQYAPGLSLTALRQTCQRFRQIYTGQACSCWIDEFNTVLYCNIESLEPGYFNGDDLSEWRLALKREQYRTKCSKDKDKDKPTSSKLRCSSCSTKHPRSHFSDSQATKDPETRICKAAETGGLQTCNHLILPFAALQRLRSPGVASRPTFGALTGQHIDSTSECPSAMGLHFCTETRKREFLHPTLGCEGNTPSLSEPMRYTEPWSYKMVLQYTILQLPAGADVHVAVVADKLRTLTGMVCQHISMSGAEVLRSLYPGNIKAALASESTVRWINDWHSTLPRDYRCTQIRGCKGVGCNTKFRVALEQVGKGEEGAKGGPKVHLLVQRDLGRLEDAGDGVWLAQREVPLGVLP